jgi:four helix bundle suffix protein
MAYEGNVTYGTYRTLVENSRAEVAANTIICLIHQANYLLDQQLRGLEKAFVKEGGMRERMTRARLNERNKPGP